MNTDYGAYVESLRNNVDTLRAQLAAETWGQATDKKRLDWLERNRGWLECTDDEWVVDMGKFFSAKGPTLREAIDKAMEAENG